MKLRNVFRDLIQKIDLSFGFSRRAQISLSASIGGARTALSFYSQTPDAETVANRMIKTDVKPEPAYVGAARSELLILGNYVKGDALTLYPDLVRYRFSDGKWIDKDGCVVNADVTHWVKASEQNKLLNN